MLSPRLLPPRLAAPLNRYQTVKVLLGVSGGADSVALLLALRGVGAEVHAAHLDHALRPESGADAQWVSELCERLGVPCQVGRVEVAKVAQKRGWNLEDAARRLRYDFLSRAAKAAGCRLILTAHTRRDQAETVLTELLRGEGQVRGIPPQRGPVERPWLEVGREELEDWLREQGQDWREDSSNADPRWTRAWLRREVMPVLRARFPAAETALARSGRWAAEDDAALRNWAEALNPHTPLKGQPPAVLRRFVAQTLRGAGLRYGGEHLQALSTALREGRTLHLTLPQGQAVSVTGGRLVLGPVPPRFPDFPLPQGWQVRTRQPGDRVRLSGGERKLSDVLTDLKVPRAERDHLPIVTDAAGEVCWVGTDPPVWSLGTREGLGVAPDPLYAAMGEALAQAQAAAQAGEVPVGAVVLGTGGQVLGRGRNTSREAGDMTQHAELAALREAAQTLGSAYLSGCTLVITLEPCPMCLGAALEARVGRIVYGAANPKAGALGGVSDLLAHGWGWRPEIRGGVRAGEAARLLRDTFGQLRRQRGEAQPSGSER